MVRQYCNLWQSKIQYSHYNSVRKNIYLTSTYISTLKSTFKIVLIQLQILDSTELLLPVAILENCWNQVLLRHCSYSIASILSNDHQRNFYHIFHLKKSRVTFGLFSRSAGGWKTLTGGLMEEIETATVATQAFCSFMVSPFIVYQGTKHTSQKIPATHNQNSKTSWCHTWHTTS